MSTTLSPSEPAPLQPRGERRIWDNSNIVESYSGVTTPLTFSFAREVYEEVYLQFCRVMGIDEALLQAYRHVFANMLGLVRGRVYYDLLNWYYALSLLPGYSFNRAFMERMMGVREKLEDPPEPPYHTGRLRDLGRLLYMTGRLWREHARLPREVDAFQARLDAALAPLAHEDFSRWSPDALLALYRRLEGELLRQWRTPLVNDFFAMIASGLLSRLVEKWLPGAPPGLANELLRGAEQSVAADAPADELPFSRETGMISTEPARRVLALARRVAADAGLCALFDAEPDDSMLWQRVAGEPRWSAFYGELRAYLDVFGDRCLNELKLETVPLGENPAFLVQMVRAYAGRRAPAAGSREELVGRSDSQSLTPGLVPDARRSAAGPRLASDALRRIPLHGLRRALFFSTLRNARRRVRDRENLRFERTRVFGLVRRIFLALGGHLAAAGHLEAPRDVFYLTRAELFAQVEGTGGLGALKSLVALRRAEFAAYEREPAPPERFETDGPADADGRVPAVVPGPARVGATTEDARALAGETARTRRDEWRGTGCCPGVVCARVCVVRDPHDARQVAGLAGRILVAERTDPGWTLLFPAARGLLVQRGGLLSHSAIVAREMGLPCVVGVAQLMETLHDGEWVEMDGARGTVRRIADPEKSCP